MIGFLFDLDGTLVDSHRSIEMAWMQTSKEIGIPCPNIFEIHGIPASATLHKYAPHLAGAEFDKYVDRLTRAEIDTAIYVAPVPGALEIVQFLNERNLPWTVVTSGIWELAEARLGAIGITLPANSVTFDQVRRGKPDPEPFITGAQRLGLKPEQCWAIEDSKGGLKSAIDAGCKTIGVLTSHEPKDLVGADHFVTHLMQIPEVLPELVALK